MDVVEDKIRLQNQINALDEVLASKSWSPLNRAEDRWLSLCGLTEVGRGSAWLYSKWFNAEQAAILSIWTLYTLVVIVGVVAFRDLCILDFGDRKQTNHPIRAAFKRSEIEVAAPVSVIGIVLMILGEKGLGLVFFTLSCAIVLLLSRYGRAFRTKLPALALVIGAALGAWSRDNSMALIAISLAAVVAYFLTFIREPAETTQLDG